MIKIKQTWLSHDRDILTVANMCDDNNYLKKDNEKNRNVNYHMSADFCHWRIKNTHEYCLFTDYTKFSRRIVYDYSSAIIKKNDENICIYKSQNFQ